MPSGSELFVCTLKHFGVTHLFTLVGDHLNDVLRVAEREGLRLIDVRHESAATHMADGWARLTRWPGVSVVTGGPGHTNSLTGIATANLAGSPLIAVSGSRARALADVAGLAAQSHAALAPAEALSVTYAPRFNGREGGMGDISESEATDAYADALRRGLSRDIAAGMTLAGPHRDDVAIQLDGLPAAGYASRAQQRTIALALRLAEARFLAVRRGEPPLLLLDDVLSEMDAARRQFVVNALEDVEQVLVTGTDWDRFSANAAGGARFVVRDGSVEALDEVTDGVRISEA